MSIEQRTVKVEKDREAAFIVKLSIRRVLWRVLFPRLDRWKQLISLPILPHLIHRRENHEGHQWRFDLQMRSSG